MFVFMSPNQRPVLELVLDLIFAGVGFWFARDLIYIPYWFRGNKIPMLGMKVVWVSLGSRSRFVVGRVLKGEGKTNSETSGP